MVGKRGVYINIFGALLVGVVLVFLNSVVLNGFIPDKLYRFFSYFGPDPSDASMARVLDEALIRENESLRKQLDVSDRGDISYATAKIIGIQRTNLSSTITIDYGSSHGAKKGMPVVIAGNILIGSIGEVFDSSSRVILTDDPRSRISARFQGSIILAEAQGMFSNRISLNLVSHTEKVTHDSLVVTSGLDVFPDGLAIARVTSIQEGTHSLFQEIEAKSFFSFHESPNVFILLQ